MTDLQAAVEEALHAMARLLGTIEGMIEADRDRIAALNRDLAEMRRDMQAHAENLTIITKEVRT